MKSCHFRPFDDAIDKEMVKDFLAETLLIGCDEPVDIRGERCQLLRGC